MKRDFADLTLKEAMQMIPATSLTRWQLDAPPRPPSHVLLEWLQRLLVFDQRTSDAANVIWIDALLAEIVFDHPGLRIWKSVPIESENLTGIADYLIASDFAYLTTPLLCVAEAKRGDFVQGRAQCVAEMVACKSSNKLEGHEMDVFGIVSNGQEWQFYRLVSQQMIYETDTYAMRNLPELLGALDYVIAQCAQNVPQL